MDINNDSRISNLIANSISKLNLNTATRAFEANKKSPKEIEQEEVETKKEDISLIENNLSSNNEINVEEIQKYAQEMGENLSIDDINYGLKYGRSVIADYSA